MIKVDENDVRKINCGYFKEFILILKTKALI